MRVQNINTNYQNQTGPNFKSSAIFVIKAKGSEPIESVLREGSIDFFKYCQREGVTPSGHFRINDTQTGTIVMNCAEKDDKYFIPIAEEFAKGSGWEVIAKKDKKIGLWERIKRILNK